MVFPSIKLKIAETDIRFVGKGLASIDPKIMDDLQLQSDDVVELKEKKNNLFKIISGLNFRL